MTEPYHDSLDHLRAELDRLDVLLRYRLEECWEETGGVFDEFRGMYVSDEEVDGLLDLIPRDGIRNQWETSRSTCRERLADVTDELRRRSRLDPSSKERLRFVTLAERFDLNRHERDVLLVALAPELDHKYERIYAYLQDDITKTRPTVDFAFRVLYHSDSERLQARALVGRRSRLVRNQLLTVGSSADRSVSAQTLSMDDRITEFVLGSDTIDARLAGVETIRPVSKLDDLAIDDKPHAVLARLASMKSIEPVKSNQDGSRRHRPSAVYLSGPHGVGRDSAVKALCRSAPELLLADARSVPDPADPVWLSLLVREARLRNVPLYVKGVDSSDDEKGFDTGMILNALDEFEGPLFVSSTERLPIRVRSEISNHELFVVDLPAPSYGVRKAIWKEFELPADVDPSVLAATFTLTAGRINDVVRMATREARAAGEPLTKETIYRCCRAQTSETLESIAKKIEPSYGWNSIVLPNDRLMHLREVAAHVKHRGTVYADWGFEDKFSLGNGLVVLFTGPSGTGKTMAAEIVAGDAGLDLYKIDLSSVVSKYIGETEKNLRRIFDEAENGNVVLLFDEADALFGKRSEVKDAHDRYANIEIDYLLQRLEEHDGTVLLTTNFKQNIDDAFLRRIHLSVDFPMPDRWSRAAIWQSIFPTETPVETLDIDFLAGFELSGGSIKNVALTAAFLAADDGEEVTMRHVVRSMRREFQKTGRIVRPDEFGRYRSFLSS